MPSGSAAAQNAASPLKNKSLPLPDYSHAGYGFRIAPLPSNAGKVIEATAHGLVPDDGKGRARALLKALAAADTVSGTAQSCCSTAIN
jgi:hypothetical protein